MWIKCVFHCYNTTTLQYNIHVLQYNIHVLQYYNIIYMLTIHVLQYNIHVNNTTR